MNQALLFSDLYGSSTEQELEDRINSYPELQNPFNWFPIGGNESNFGIIENQQSNPIAALVEKVTNSMDAILMKKCLESNIEPKSIKAPKSMEDAVKLFFPDNKNWDLSKFRRAQSEEIQVIADGPTRNTSVIIYDNGEGQYPADFENTFLSLVRGNKNEIMFVQGKYNMGGSGAIVFCGKKGYQLIASKKFDNKGNFGFTLIRQHPLSAEEENTKKNTWYEYLKIDGQIPNFEVTELDLGLHNRKFKTGTIIKLYSYQFPSGYSGFAQDLNQSFNEFLFQPVLPMLTVDKKERYPNNKVLELDLFGLKRRLEDDDDYIDGIPFSEEYEDNETFGKVKVTCYVFKSKIKDYDVKRSKEIIRSRFFKNNMSVMFSINGQAHGHYTSEFITRTLKFNLLRDYLLIHVDCTNIKYSFRKALFMASRDRLKQGDESNFLRDYIGKKLRNSYLDEIDKRRKSSTGLESEDTNELIKSLAKNLNKDSELFKLLQNTLKLEEKKKTEKTKTENKIKTSDNQEPFKPQRYPSFLKLNSNQKEGIPIITIPKGGEKVIKFSTDVENSYFDRSDDPGAIEIALLNIKPNETSGGNVGTEKKIEGVLKVAKSSPVDGTIKIAFSPNETLQVGDEIQIKVSLSSPEGEKEELVWVKIKEPDAPKEPTPKPEEDFDSLGLPKLERVNKENWEQLEDAGISMNYDTVMAPIAKGNVLEKIFINLDSRVFLNYRTKLKSEDQILTAQKKYLSSVYFHTLFLYMITQKKNYRLTIPINEKDEEDVSIDTYLKDVFDSYYSDFLLNFGMEQLMGVLEE